MSLHIKTVLILLISCSFNVKSQQNILLIGDSHGAANEGWVYHLMQIRPEDKFCNLSISGNTIGFSNLNRDTLNTLHNIRSYIQRGNEKLRNIDKVLILLGTNDCKSVFKDSFLMSVGRFESIIQIIRNSFPDTKQPAIIYITPPPFDDDNKLTEKYIGGNSRLKILIPQLLKAAKKQHVKTINLNKIIGKNAGKNTIDGVHYNSEGYKKIAQIINRLL